MLSVQGSLIEGPDENFCFVTILVFQHCERIEGDFSAAFVCRFPDETKLDPSLYRRPDGFSNQRRLISCEGDDKQLLS